MRATFFGYLIFLAGIILALGAGAGALVFFNVSGNIYFTLLIYYAIICFGSSFAAGYWSRRSALATAFFMTVFQVLTILLPIFWLVPEYLNLKLTAFLMIITLFFSCSGSLCGVNVASQSRLSQAKKNKDENK